MDFLTGFNEKSTTLGFIMENNDFSIKYNGIINIGSETNIAFENGYNWAQVMSILLNMDQGKEFIRSTMTSRGTDNRYDVLEYLLTLDLVRWLCTFQGWGIMWNIIRPDYKQYFSEKLIEMKEEMEVVKDYSGEKVFDKVMEIFQTESCLELSDIMPPIALNINDLVSDIDNSEEKLDKRKKDIVIQFGSEIIALFKMEKKKLETDLTLLDIAANVIVESIDDKEEFHHLELPASLVKTLEDKLWDLWWRSNN